MSQGKSLFQTMMMFYPNCCLPVCEHFILKVFMRACAVVQKMKEKIGHPHKQSVWGPGFFGMHDPKIQNAFNMINRMETRSESGKSQLQSDRDLSKSKKSNRSATASASSATAKQVPHQSNMNFSEVSYFFVFMPTQINNVFI